MLKNNAMKEFVTAQKNISCYYNYRRDCSFPVRISSSTYLYYHLMNTYDSTRSTIRSAALSVAILLGSMMLPSCADTTPSGPTNTDTVTVRTVTFTPDSVDSYYFSFDSGVPVIVEKMQEGTWDMMVKPVWGGGKTTQIDILFNSGSVNAMGTTTAYVVDTTFDNVSTVTPSLFRVDSASASGRIASIDLTGKGIFNYEPAKRTISPNAQKSIIVKSAAGGFFKVQFVSLNVPMSRSELGTFVMRYAKAVGTRLK
jgi:hypothetical protein